ncbi:uncharacterized protein B0J16DRAFT_365681 [Fusarium flagelliforme]|uniref:uncharacterized protein n=1 Tax=Fusarium flagelliforme TaxID=2675880 RepID=UPI001E8D9C11|nr:uncharacterized protein B0J16DRAFT_365681 [Fusarium flagelliforme]KAH7196305.1 hypothetical protein B0J16DRAFT_365681 [Fusarium flagelliforme]
MADVSRGVQLPASSQNSMSSTERDALHLRDMTSHSLINDTPSSLPAAPRRKPVPGKGFQKTRRGCFICKRRRVKCSEHRPECQGCRRMRSPCVYPAVVLPDPRTVPSAPTVKVCLDHLRFFHHFLAEAYPPHPYGASTVWQDVAALSHQYDFLASSILALAAQHLTVTNKADYSMQALNLRISAIKGLNDALSQPCNTAADADARCAAIIALTFQSTYMPDGLMEFLAMIRGWMLIATTLVTGHETSIFRHFTRASWVGSMERYIEEQHETKYDMPTEDFLASLGIVQPLLQGKAELEYLSSLVKLAVLSKTSPRDALLEIVFYYASTNKMTDKDHASFTAPSNYGAQVLLAHFLVLNHMLEQCFLGATNRHFSFSKKITRSWILDIGRRLPDGFQSYMMWPLGQARDITV